MRYWWLGAFLLVCLGAWAQGREAVVWGWDSREEFDQCTRDRYLDSLTRPGEVALTRGFVIADEMGAGYNDFQPIAGKTQARKVLLIDDPRAASALLLVDGSVAGCDIVVNGTVLGAAPLAKSYWHANFERYPVPPRLLKAGANILLFRARDPKRPGSIRVERSQQPDRSAVSRDGGVTWEGDALCEGGYMNGELGVRLRLEGYPRRAWLASPVLDLAAAAMRDGIPAGVDGRIDDLRVDADVPKGTAVRVLVRTGPTPDAHPECWSPWTPWAKGLQFERFAQWRLELTSNIAAVTPVVRKVTVQASAAPAPADPGFAVMRLAEDANQHIVRSSYEYAYAGLSGNARVLREQWKLADVVAGPPTEFGKLTALRQWVREQWRDGWSMGSLNYIPSWDARVILSLAPGNHSLGMCTHYATTFVQCAQALGYLARPIFRGHALSEAWSNDYGKWVTMDAGLDPNDRRRATYHFTRNGVPLNEMEVRTAYFVDKHWDDIVVAATNASEGTAIVEKPFAENREELFNSTRQLFLPLRNNFIDHREPEEPEHGQGYFKFLGHLFWKDELTPEVPWTDFTTSRPADFYWTLNQAQIHLQPAGPAGTLRVLLDTVTPNFTGYEYRVDGGAWTAAAPAFPRSATGGTAAFAWTLHAGANTLEARPINAAGLRGIISRVVVEAIRR